MDAGRQTNGFGLSPLSWTDIAHWSAFTGAGITPAAVTLLLRIDRAYLDENGKIQSAKQKKKA